MTSDQEISGLPDHQDQTAYFGYRRVSAAEKGKLVHRHFDTVARRYDLLNSLLSFGMHHLWKRAAVRMMQLKPGAKVIDVCGGTADLAIRAARIIGSEPPALQLRYLQSPPIRSSSRSRTKWFAP